MGGLVCLGFAGGLGDLGAEMQNSGDAVCAHFLHQGYLLGDCMCFKFVFPCFCAFLHVFTLLVC